MNKFLGRKTNVVGMTMVLCGGGVLYYVRKLGISTKSYFSEEIEWKNIVASVG
jgi:hypothetical protein